MSDVFISHSSKDAEIANKVCKFLEEKGLSCWIAPRNIVPGADWAASISTAITASKVFLIIYSENSAASTQVPREIGLAEGEPNVYTIPYRIDETPLTGSFAYYLKTAHWVNANYSKNDYKLEELYSVITAITGKNIQNITNNTYIDNLHIHNGEGASQDLNEQVNAAKAAVENLNVPPQNNNIPAQNFSGFSENAVPPQQHPSGKKKTPVIIAAAVAGVLLVAGIVIAVIAMSGSDDSSKSSKSSSKKSKTTTTAAADDEDETEEVTEEATKKSGEPITVIDDMYEYTSLIGKDISEAEALFGTKYTIETGTVSFGDYTNYSYSDLYFSFLPGGYLGDLSIETRNGSDLIHNVSFVLDNSVHPGRISNESQLIELSDYIYEELADRYGKKFTSGNRDVKNVNSIHLYDYTSSVIKEEGYPDKIVYYYSSPYPYMVQVPDKEDNSHYRIIISFSIPD